MRISLCLNKSFADLLLPTCLTHEGDLTVTVLLFNVTGESS